ncbi:MAG: hypothetical protein IT447_15040 [Phycisphaerales bacterium]|nr:hypothetical protein [Phycisphaerales bacterium]
MNAPSFIAPASSRASTSPTRASRSCNWLPMPATHTDVSRAVGCPLIVAAASAST